MSEKAMREILFRGKRKDNGEWVEGAYYHETEFYGDDCDYHYIILTKDVLEDNMMSYVEVIPETIGQYTGLTDKNGKKIFEGDIVKDKISRVIYRVFYCVDSAMFIKEGVLRSSLGNTHHLEVIGNIHDNPGLLRGGVE